jgi:adenosyl cobinamide kinase/adenosyl cobinamide phosphate guanylyltransferase
MNTQREARRDAKEYARAQMYYGEGAGTRRKLIGATVEAKADRDPSYAREFRNELSRQDMAEHATKARHERERKDTVDSVKKNTRALVTGNYQNVQSGVLLVCLAAYFAHRTGLDEKMYRKSQQIRADIQVRYKAWRLRKTKINPVN